MNTLRTDLCTLEPQLASHAEEMFSVLCDPAIYEFEGEPPPSVEALRAGYTRRESRLSPDGSEKWLNWVVRLRTGELTGYVQATVLSSGASYIGYEFSSQYWRRGLASISVKTVANELANNYQVHTIVALFKSQNYRSIGLLTKLGFVAGSELEALRYEVPDDENLLLFHLPKTDA